MIRRPAVALDVVLLGGRHELGQDFCRIDQHRQRRIRFALLDLAKADQHGAATTVARHSPDNKNCLLDNQTLICVRLTRLQRMHFSHSGWRLLTALSVFVFSTCVWAQGATGSGFFITENGYIVTNFHVVANFDTFTVRDHRGKVYPARLIQRDTANDLAILKVDGKFTALPIGRSQLVRLADNVFTLGYPNTRVQGLAVKFSEGTISGLSGIRDEPNSFQISVPLQPGNSGGPLLNRYGLVVGVVVAKLDAITSIKGGSGIPEVVNYAIKSNYLFELMQTDRNVTNELPSVNKKSRTMPMPELVAQLESSVVMVISSGSRVDQEKAPPKPGPPKSEIVRPRSGGGDDNREVGGYCESGTQCKTGLWCDRITHRCESP